MREVSAYVTQQFNRYVMGVESLDTFDQFYRQLKEWESKPYWKIIKKPTTLCTKNKINLHFASVPGVYALAKSASFHPTPTLPPFSELGAGSLALSPFGCMGLASRYFIKFHQTKPVQTRIDGDGLLYRLFQGEGANVREVFMMILVFCFGRELEFCVCVLRRNPGSQAIFHVQLKSRQRWEGFRTAQWGKRHAPAPCCQCLRFRENPSAAE